VVINNLFAKCYKASYLGVGDESKPQYDKHILGNRGSADPTSPISYVRGFIGKRLRILLVDGQRIIVGRFSALDHTGTITITDATQLSFGGNEREVGTAMIGLDFIQHMELAE
jgi:small nuclear ribonucleoprotein (snRNP)-like protein